MRNCYTYQHKFGPEMGIVLVWDKDFYGTQLTNLTAHKQ